MSRTRDAPHRISLAPGKRAMAGTDMVVRRDPTATRVAVITGVIFVAAGLVKFVFHHWELHAFREFGLPFPSAMELLAGLVETAGGVLLALRLMVVPTALVLGVTMLVAIAASGIGHGDVIPSLTVAPALMGAMVFLLLRSRPPDADR